MKHQGNSLRRPRIPTFLQLAIALAALVPAGNDLQAANLFAWGAGTNNSMTAQNYNQSVIPPNVTNPVAIAAGGMHSLALRPDGRVSAWGLNNFGQTLVPGSLTTARAISAGLLHSLALRSNGTVQPWGNASYGQNSAAASATNVSAIASGWYHNLALRSNGTVVAWGAGLSSGVSPNFGQSLVPTNLTDVMAIAAGGYHSLALRSNGTVAAWGWNGDGQTNVPPTVTDVVAIAAGASNSVALRRDGTVIVWGSVAYGQTNVPASISNVVAIAAGAGHILALRADGMTEAWGWNAYTQTNLPPGISNVTAISAGAFHNLALINLGPATFLNQPVSQTVFRGDTAQFSAAAVGQPTPTYQWLFHGVPLPDATNRILLLNNAEFANAGDYQLVAAQPSLAITSSIARLTVNDTAPYFIIQPTNQVSLLGSNVLFIAQVGGVPPLHYQWQRDGTDLPARTNLTLALTNVTPASEGVYRLVARNAAGTNTSSAAYLDVLNLAEALNATNLVWSASTNPPWVIQRQVTHDGVAAVRVAPVFPYSNASLSTRATGPGTLTFWWQQNSAWPPEGLSFYMNGQATAQPAGLSGQWQKVTIYLPTGTNLLEWRHTAISISAPIGYLDEVTFVPGPVPPLLTSFIADRTLPAGTNVTFSIAAGGTPPLVYQWTLAGTNLPGATNATLALVNIQPADAGEYMLVITNAYGSTNEIASLTVTNSAPVIWTAPTSREMVPGGTVVFDVVARGSDPLAYQWQFEETDLPGATNAALRLDRIQPEHAGRYRVTIINAFGSVMSPVATLTLVPTAIVGWGSVFTSSPNPPMGLTNVAAISAGDDYSVALRTDGTVVAWGWDAFSRLNVPAGLSNVTRISAGGFHGSTLLNNGTVVNWGDPFFDAAANVPAGLSNVVEIAAGYEFNLALKRDGSVQAWGEASLGPLNLPQPLTNVVALGAGRYHGLAVKRDGTVTAWGYYPSGQTNVPSTATNVVAVSAGNLHSLALRADGSVVAWGSGIATNLPNSLTGVVAIDSGSHHALALHEDGTVSAWGQSTSEPMLDWLTNVVAISAGSEHSLALLNDGSPYITRQPWTQSVLPGETTRFEVVAMGYAPRAYQWLYHQAPIPGATNASLILSNTPATAAGIYHCIVANAIGSVTSAPAWLTVSRPVPQIVAAGFGLSGGSDFGLQVSGLSGHGNIILTASSNLVHWESIKTNGPVIGELLLSDPQSGIWPHRFYRVVEE